MFYSLCISIGTVNSCWNFQCFEVSLLVTEFLFFGGDFPRYSVAGGLGWSGVVWGGLARRRRRPPFDVSVTHRSAGTGNEILSNGEEKKKKRTNQTKIETKWNSRREKKMAPPFRLRPFPCAGAGTGARNDSLFVELITSCPLRRARSSLFISRSNSFSISVSPFLWGRENPVSRIVQKKQTNKQKAIDPFNSGKEAPIFNSTKTFFFFQSTLF